MLAAVREYGYDGLELRLLDGEPIDVLSLDAGTRRAVGTALARAAVPLVCLDTSIELAQPFDRDCRRPSSWRASGARRRCACSAARPESR